MELSLSTSQKLTQSLNMEQLQNLVILQMANFELESYIREKAEENPLIAVIEPDVHHLHHLLDMSTIHSSTNYTALSEQKIDFLQQNIVAKKSIREMIFEQIPLQKNLSVFDLKILNYIVQNLNAQYFLDMSLEEIAERFETSYETVENLLYLLHTFEPIGIGARNLEEYLLIQVANDPNAPALASVFIKHHLNDLACCALKQISKANKIPIKETQKVFKYIQSLSPKPQVSDQSEHYEVIIPEMTFSKVNDEWVIQMNTQNWSKVELDQMYVELLKQSEEDKDYYKHTLKDAMLLMQGIDQRERTLYAIARLLLEHQEDFFEYGIDALKPMMLKDFAKWLGVHESTISRAIKNKAIKTPHGIFYLRSLFVKGMTNYSGKMDSVTYIKQQIQQYIEKENHQRPLSDQQLTNLLKAEGMNISRRTIAKYREELNIPNSSKRIYLYL